MDGPVTQGAPERGDASSRATGVTLPPPEWTRPGHGRGRTSDEAPPLSRRNGKRADEAHLRARLDEARTSGDIALEREISAQLARWLAARERDLDEATQLAFRALRIEEEGALPPSGSDADELRRELAAWLESLGEAGLAAAELRKLAQKWQSDAVASSAILVRVGVLHARSGDAVGAGEAFTEAARRNPQDALACELLGMLASWAPDIVTAEQAALAYIDGAARRAASGGPGCTQAELENMLRAFEADPTYEAAARALAGALEERGKNAAADEIWREHARASERRQPEWARLVFASRRLAATDDGDVARALGAALDEGLDRETDGESAEKLDELLLRAGLLEPLAERLTIRAERAHGAREKARLYEELAHLYAGPLADAARAATAHMLALAAQPGHVEAIAALKAYAARLHDSTQLVEGLVRAVSVQDGGDPELRAGRLSSARLLSQVASDMGQQGIAAWAHETVLAIDPDDAVAAAGLKRAAQELAALRAELVRARRELASSSRETRVEALRRIVTVLRGMPGDADVLAEVLSELARLVPEEHGIVLEAARIASRLGEKAEAVRIARERVEDDTASAEARVEARILLGVTARALGNVREANDATRALLEALPGDREAASMAWMNAALAGDDVTRARAIAALATEKGSELSSRNRGSVAATLHAFASERLLDAGDTDGALREAEKACQVDPDRPRAVVAFARAICQGGRIDRKGASALERAVDVVAPRATWCTALANAHEELGEPGRAATWSQRLLALRPGDRACVQALLDRVVRTKDATMLGDALASVLSEPQPARVVGDLIARPLEELAHLDPGRAVVLARRALEVLGPRHTYLREAMQEVAETARDDAFAGALIERWAASGAPAAERKALFSMLAGRAARGRDVESEIRALTRALREGALPSEFADRIVTLTGDALTGDGELALLEARAELLEAGEPEPAVRAYRELGAAAWDLAGNRARALQAWLRAAKLSPSGGYMTLGLDLARFADAAYALDVLGDLVEREQEPARAGALAGEAAQVAIALDEPVRAFDFARLALAKSPSLGDALEIAERAGAATERLSDMSELYDALAQRALGRFGRRAAHYRGARFFEHRGRLDLALKHAAQAFTAVPSEGSALVLLSRTADRADARAVAVRAVEQVAELAPSAHARAAWLLRAASLAGNGEEGARQRFDVLLRAVALAPDKATIALLADAARELLQKLPEERDVVQMRLVRAAEALAQKIDGPEGARVAIAFAELGLDLFGDADGALLLVERALGVDGDLEEYGRLVSLAAALAHAGDAPESLRRAMEAAQKPYSNVGAPALKMLAALARALGDAKTRANALVMAVEKDEDDDDLVAEADLALSTCPDPDLLERFAKKVPNERRSALRGTRGRDESAGPQLATTVAQQSAIVPMPDPAPQETQGEVRGVYGAVVYDAEVEARLLREANDETVLPVTRADRWAEIGHGREGLGDMVGAAEALEKATLLDPEPIGRWSELDRLGELASRPDLRVAALKRLVAHLDADERAVPAMKRLARALDSFGDPSEAEAMWRRIGALEPADEEVDYAVEALVTARGDYEELAAHLARRAERLGANVGTRDALRPVRLRRAAILEQRLDRIDEAREELEKLLAEWPDNESALSYLADLHERKGEPARAIPLWVRVANLARNPDRRAELLLRAARACAMAGELEQALDHVREVLAERPTDPEALELRVEIARSLESTRELGDALNDLATASPDDVTVRSDMLVEASQAAARAGDMAAALDRAQRAAQLAPHRAKTQLFARGLEYRVRGGGAPDEARATIEQLGKIKEALDVEDAALQAFLLAEALDAVQGGGAGLRQLSERYHELGAHPLIALGMAERLVQQWDFALAVPLFDAALKGNLLGLRRRGAVALAAADAALRCERTEDAMRFFDEAANDPETRTTALRRVAQIAAAGGDVQRSRRVLLELARSAEGSDRARTLAQLGRALFTSQEPQDRVDAEQAFVEAIEAAAPDEHLVTQLEAELEDLRRRQSIAPSAMASIPPPDLSFRGPLQIVGVPESEPVITAEPVSIADLEKAAFEAKEPADRATKRLVLARALIDEAHFEDAEKLLWLSLADGSAPAGDLLSAQLERDSTRTGELVRVRRRLVDMAPGDLDRLEALIAAAQADHNTVYARALEHVLRAFDPGAGPLPPPPLAAQIEQPGMLQLLARHSLEPAGEALALVWEGAGAQFARTPQAYGITGLERVVPSGSSVLARLYEIAVRILDAPRIPLFLRRALSPLAHGVALLQPPAAIISGDAREDGAELRFVLGQALSAALPQNALVLGLTEIEGRAMWNAILGAFGPPELGRELDSASGRIAETFWQVLPARAQRRLKELLETAHRTRYELLAERARQSGRRVGLFLTGDFGFAARALVREEATLNVAELSAPGGLEAACARLPSLGDLYRLAVRPEYAGARWHPEGASRRSSARIKV